MRSPNPVDEPRLVGQRHAARRRAENQRQTPARIGRSSCPARAQRARRPGMRVDEPGADRRSGPKRHGRGGLGRQSSPERRARRRRLGADASVMVVFEEPEADLIEECVRPAPLMREIGEFTGRRAGRAGQRPGGAKRQEIGEIEEMPGVGDRFRLASGEPGQLGRMHFGRDLAAHIAQRPVTTGVDPVGVVDGAMIHPHDHVAFGRVGRAHRQGTRVAVKGDQRACGVEAHAANRLGRQPGRLDRFADRRRHRAPDVVGRLLDDVARRAPDGDRSPGAGDQLSGRIEDSGPGAERADVHSDIGLAHAILRRRSAAGDFSVSGVAGKRRRLGSSPRPGP